MLFRLQQLDLTAVEHTEKPQEMRNKYLPGKNTSASVYLNPNPSGLAPGYSAPGEEKTWLCLTLHFVLLSLRWYQQVAFIAVSTRV